MTALNAATRIMPEEVETADVHPPEAEHGWALATGPMAMRTLLGRVDNPSLQHTLEVFEMACAPRWDLCHSMMARAMSGALVHRPPAAPALPGGLVWGGVLEERYPGGRAFLWTDGAFEYIADFVGQAGAPDAVVFENTWAERWDTEVGGDDELTAAIVTAEDDVVGVVERLAEVLGLPSRDVLKAAQIKKSSFYSWKKSHARPRVASQGCLWALAQVVDELAETVSGPLRAWVLADGRRRAALVAGDFDSLIDDATGIREPRPYERAGAATFGVGSDLDDHLRDAGRAAPEPAPFAKAIAASVHPTSEPDR